MYYHLLKRIHSFGTNSILITVHRHLHRHQRLVVQTIPYEFNRVDVGIVTSVSNPSQAGIRQERSFRSVIYPAPEDNATADASFRCDRGIRLSVTGCCHFTYAEKLSNCRCVSVNPTSAKPYDLNVMLNGE